MSIRSRASSAVAVLLFTALFFATVASGQDAPLADQLKAEYKLAKLGLDSSGWSVVDPGTVLVIQKGGVLGVPPGNATMAPATYKDGSLHAPNGFAAAMVSKISRQLPAGEKVYVAKIDVHLKNDKITFTIVECDSCNGAQQRSSYKAAIVFEFPKDYLSKADVSQVKDVIGAVLAPDTGSNDQQQAQTQQQPASEQAPAAPPTIEPGQTIDQVKAALGQPEKIVNMGPKQIYLYKDLKITFVDGKVVDVQ